MKLGAAFALERITGANLIENTEVEPEALDAPEGDDPADPFAMVGPPDKKRDSLAREVSHPRDLPAEPSPELIDLPTTRVRRWSAWLTREEKRFQTKVPLRFRRGRPFTPNAALDELKNAGPLGSALAGERRVNFADLVISTGDIVAFDPIQFVQDQDAALKAWQAIADKASSVPGTWDKPMRKRR